MNKWTYSRAAADVIGERARQVEGEGWTPEHDDQHDAGEIATAAALYAMESGHLGIPLSARISGLPKAWPWSREWWKPKDRRSDLVRAAALIIAEIERLDRASPPAFAPASAAVMPPPALPISMGTGQFNPAMVWYHGEDTDTLEVAANLGLEAAFIALETDAPELAERYAEAFDDTPANPDEILAAWQPPVPEGFTLAGRYHGEDGAYALFLREGKAS